MGLDLELFGSKLSRYREQFQSSLADVSDGTGIPAETIREYEEGLREPTGDHVLIFADFYKCDYKFFLSSDQKASFEQTETLFRMIGDELSKSDRWAIQEFLFLCECEEFLFQSLPQKKRSYFKFTPRGDVFKAHGKAAAAALREHLGYSKIEIGMDVFRDFRKIGLHVFRRHLDNSKISGLFVRHPFAGACILINYSEDVYRQRFTAAHEAGHAILDIKKEVNVSFTKWDSKDLSEIRANTFASHFLMPPEFLSQIPDAKNWTQQKCTQWASKLKVSTFAFSIALLEARLISRQQQKEIWKSPVPAEAKMDAELSSNLSHGARVRKANMLQHGLSNSYVELCFEA
ncbi:MAG: ImmA/IrrE family metallo-endopeptidase, partial [Planctomycetaceae bacterium]|nr:ImmA/IrrE family metallo-endopeptidase [Planctomycetaceae bacterium]